MVVLQYEFGGKSETSNVSGKRLQQSRYLFT
ncbi:uncharacterized protein METZ01_LOCUS389067 [marine metagenome]|uniref:Uncharacterized protein n=1 Tax=marine metagenome TaxID=408172 RepID=A0A382UPL9_9ZZZZ